MMAKTGVHHFQGSKYCSIYVNDYIYICIYCFVYSTAQEVNRHVVIHIYQTYDGVQIVSIEYMFLILIFPCVASACTRIIQLSSYIIYISDNVELGTACGRYYRVSCLSISDPGDSDIIKSM